MEEKKIVSEEKLTQNALLHGLVVYFHAHEIKGYGLINHSAVVCFSVNPMPKKNVFLLHKVFRSLSKC